MGVLRYVPFVMEPQTAPERKEWFKGRAVNVLCIGKFEERKNHRLFAGGYLRPLGRRGVSRSHVLSNCGSTYRVCHRAGPSAKQIQRR